MASDITVNIEWGNHRLHIHGYSLKDTKRVGTAAINAMEVTEEQYYVLDREKAM